MEIKDKLISLIESSGKMFRKVYLEKHHIDILEEVLKYSENFKLIEIDFKEQVYCYIKNITEIQKCKNPNCNNKVKFRNSTLGYFEYCCNYCIGTDPKMVEKKENTSVKNYGVKYPQKLKEVKEKIRKTNQKRYGCNAPMQNKEVQQKSKNTFSKNYGKKDTKEYKEYIRKRVESFMINVDSWKEKFTNTMNERYGGIGLLPHLTDPIIIKQSKTKKLINFFKKLVNKHKHIKFNSVDIENRKFNIHCNLEEHNFDININLFISRMKHDIELCTICNPLNSSSSSQELYIRKFLKNLGLDFIINSRQIIPPYEIDMYLDEYKLGIEFNGLFWHNLENKGCDYHKMKQLKTEKMCINLIQIWEDDWKNKENIVKSFISELTFKPTKIIDKFEIIEIDSEIKNDFLLTNNIGGYFDSKLNIGLYIENILISILCVGETCLFCNKLFNEYIDTYKILLEYYVNTHNKELKLLIDKSYNNSKIFLDLGFVKNCDIVPKNYFVYNKIRYNEKQTEKDFIIYDAGHMELIYKK